jgi:5-methylthioadenosine/S-adenosylhomocysteine deaminase
MTHIHARIKRAEMMERERAGSVSIYTPAYLWTGHRFQAGMGVLVEGDRVLEVADADDLVQRSDHAERRDWSGLIMMPGTVNAHCHSFQSLLRGFVVDQPFLVWRDRSLYRYAPYLDEDAVYAGALLSFGEMLRYGVTTVTDFFYVHNGGVANDEAVIQAAADVGIRLVFARTMYDWRGAPDGYRETVAEATERTRALAARYQGNPMVHVCPAPHSLHGASAEMIQAGHRLAQELGTRFHIHVAEEHYQVEQCESEHGCRPVQYLHRLGVVDTSMVAVHLCWLSMDEIALLGAHHANLAYCPSSNMFLADGVTELPALLQAGVAAALGTDGLCSNNQASVFEEMRTAALLQKLHRLDATAITARQVFDMGTSGGGQALDVAVGQIAPGCFADFVGVGMGDLSMQPALAETILANIVYASRAPAVSRVVVGGREVACHGELRSVPNAEIVRRVENVVERWPRPVEGEQSW